MRCKSGGGRERNLEREDDDGFGWCFFLTRVKGFVAGPLHPHPSSNSANEHLSAMVEVEYDGTRDVAVGCPDGSLSHRLFLLKIRG